MHGALTALECFRILIGGSAIYQQVLAIDKRRQITGKKPVKRREDPGAGLLNCLW
jgi:hypothetical protein